MNMIIPFGVRKYSSLDDIIHGKLHSLPALHSLWTWFYPLLLSENLP